MTSKIGRIPSPRTHFERFVLFLATGAGVGYIPIMPGTWGSVLAVGLFLLLASMPPALYLLTLAALCFLAAWISGLAGELFGRHDASNIVIDEIVGFLVTLALVPAYPGYLIAGFIAFRVFDIAKPFPAGMIDRKWGDLRKGGRIWNGWGVVLDDVVAGIYANVAVRVVAVLLGSS